MSKKVPENRSVFDMWGKKDADYEIQVNRTCMKKLFVQLKSVNVGLKSSTMRAKVFFGGVWGGLNVCGRGVAFEFVCAHARMWVTRHMRACADRDPRKEVKASARYRGPSADRPGGPRALPGKSSGGPYWPA